MKNQQRSRAAGLLVPLLALMLQVSAFAAPVAYVTNEKGGVSVIDLDTLTVQKEIPTGGQGPRGLAITKDGDYLLTANKTSNDVSVIDTKTGQVARRIPVGKNVEFVRIFGDLAYVTYEPGESGGPPGKAEEQKKDKDDDAKPAEIAVIDLKSWKVVKSIKSGLETEGIEFSPDGKYLLVTNEGDNTISVYDRLSGDLVKSIKTAAYGNRPRGIKRTPDGKGYVVTLEFSDKLLQIDANFDPVKTFPTKQGPYGVAFDPEGKRLFIAAGKAGVLQVLDARTYGEIAEVALGKRCWHFSFTPDASKLLVACGRSDAVYVVDATKYDVVKTLSGAKTPWGIVTYPKSTGSIDMP